MPRNERLTSRLNEVAEECALPRPRAAVKEDSWIATASHCGICAKRYIERVEPSMREEVVMGFKKGW